MGKKRMRGGHTVTGAVLLMALLALVSAGCGAGSSSQGQVTITPIPSVTPTATATATPTPIPTPTATPKPKPTPTPTSRPTPTTPPAPPAACVPAPGVEPVSSSVIYSGPTNTRAVSLTFDSDGGAAGNANRYLDILSEYDLRATWFLTGQFASANPSVVRRIQVAGDDIGNHTFDHPDLISPARSDSFICSELTQANSIISGVTGRTTRPYFRPPYGDSNMQVRTLAARLGYRTIDWSIDPRDWDSNNTAQMIVNSVLNSANLKPGAIILMHVNSAHEGDALGEVIAGLQQRGYAIVPLSELLGG